MTGNEATVLAPGEHLALVTARKLAAQDKEAKPALVATLVATIERLLERAR